VTFKGFRDELRERSDIGDIEYEEREALPGADHAVCQFRDMASECIPENEVRTMVVDPQTGWLKATGVLFEAAQIMIPVITGYLVIVVGSIGKVWEKRKELSDIRWRYLIHSTLLGLGALGFWIGVLPACIMATDTADEFFFRLGQWVARLGTIQLFLAFVCFALFFAITFKPFSAEPQSPPPTKSS
jgi:hypothetical protein